MLQLHLHLLLNLDQEKIQLSITNVYFRFISLCRWLKFEEDVEDGGERWSKPYVATLSLHSLFELRSCIMNGTVMLDMRASSLEEIAGKQSGTDCARGVLQTPFPPLLTPIIEK